LGLGVGGSTVIPRIKKNAITPTTTMMAPMIRGIGRFDFIG
jgi:hypothetical protein